METDRHGRHFQDDLDQVKARLLDMGRLAEARLALAVSGLVERRQDHLEVVLSGDEAVNRFHIEIDDRCFKLLALQQPMAVDLRAIVSAIKINTDLERVGDLAVNIAEAAARYLGHPPVKELVDIRRMTAIAQEMLRNALEAYVQNDLELAQKVLRCDDDLDRLKTQAFCELLDHMRRDHATVEPSLDLILISRHVERVGDHATNIAEDVIFLVSARDVRHQAER